MDPMRGLGLSASGMAAQRARMDTIGENLANVDSTRTARGGPYRRKVVVLMPAGAVGFASFLTSASGPEGGVRVADVRESAEPFRRVYQPGHPHAGADGYVEMPNVHPLIEMLDMLSATRAYEANAAAFQATKTMTSKLIDLLRSP